MFMKNLANTAEYSLGQGQTQNTALQKQYGIRRNYANQHFLLFPFKSSGQDLCKAYSNFFFLSQILDAWHPLEKAQYPKYFALRDVRKREYIERYEKKYGTDQ